MTSQATVVAEHDLPNRQFLVTQDGEFLEQSRCGAGVAAETSEKRACDRVALKLPLGVKFGRMYHLTARTANISRGGILFHTDIQIPAGADR